jgi:hypothetical protein
MLTHRRHLYLTDRMFYTENKKPAQNSSERVSVEMQELYPYYLNGLGLIQNLLLGVKTPFSAHMPSN